MEIKYYQRYVEIKEAKKLLELEEDLIKKEILHDLEVAPEGKIANEFGKFNRSTRKTYKYSEKVDELNEMIKMRKVDEEEQGIAEKVETYYITLTKNHVK